MDPKNTNFIITISHGQKIQSFPFSKLPTYEKILDIAKSSFPHANTYTIFYVDDEGDQVSVRSAMELNEAYRLAEHQGKHTIRLYLERVEEVSELPEIHHSIPQPVPSVPSPLRPDLSSSFQRPVTDYARSQVLDFRTAEESEILVKIQNKLSEMTSVVSHLAKAKQEQTEKMKHSTEFENEISVLCLEKDRLRQSLEETQHQKKDLEMELETLTLKNGDLTEQIIQMQESFRLQLKEKEENYNRIRQEEQEMVQEALKQKTTLITSQEKNMIILRESLMKMGKELRKEKEIKSELESKVTLLTNEVDTKTGQYLEMSRRVIDVQAQKESLTMKATSLEHQLEQEHQERENLQQSLIQLQLQGSISVGKFPGEFREDSEPSGIYVVKPDDKYQKKEKVPELSSEAQRWGNELGLLILLATKTKTRIWNI